MKSFDINKYIQTYNLSNIQALRRKETGWITVLNQLIKEKYREFGSFKAIEISSDKKLVVLGTLYGTIILFDLETLEHTIIQETNLGSVVEV